MLPSLNIVKVLCQALSKFPVKGIHLYKKILMYLFNCYWSDSVLTSFLLKAALVVDPVLKSSSGDVLAGSSVLSGFLYVFLNLNCTVFV